MGPPLTQTEAEAEAETFKPNLWIVEETHEINSKALVSLVLSPTPFAVDKLKSVCSHISTSRETPSVFNIPLKRFS